jgi:ribulose 1,5-bisphosphate carboxylase large subunit-like protein
MRRYVYIISLSKNLLSLIAGSANQMNKLSLVGMQLPEQYKENFDVSSEGPSSGVTIVSYDSLQTSKFSLYFTSSCIPTNNGLFI